MANGRGRRSCELELKLLWLPYLNLCVKRHAGGVPDYKGPSAVTRRRLDQGRLGGAETYSRILSLKLPRT